MPDKKCRMAGLKLQNLALTSKPLQAKAYISFPSNLTTHNLKFFNKT
jgi:hypothetical protein